MPRCSRAVARPGARKRRTPVARDARLAHGANAAEGSPRRRVRVAASASRNACRRVVASGRFLLEMRAHERCPGAGFQRAHIVQSNEPTEEFSILARSHVAPTTTSVIIVESGAPIPFATAGYRGTQDTAVVAYEPGEPGTNLNRRILRALRANGPNSAVLETVVVVVPRNARSLGAAGAALVSRPVSVGMSWATAC